MTERTGRLVDFSGCVFFATSNAGTDSLRALGGLDDEAAAAKARDALAREAGFDKAFLARFTEIVLMDSLAPRHVAEIACLQLAKQFSLDIGWFVTDDTKHVWAQFPA